MGLELNSNGFCEELILIHLLFLFLPLVSGMFIWLLNYAEKFPNFCGSGGPVSVSIYSRMKVKSGIDKFWLLIR